MRKTYFIINPSAGKGTGLLLLPRIEQLWTANNTAYALRITENHEDIAKAAQDAIAAGATEVGIVGGDGTVLAVINGLMNSMLPIGIIPCGTGNDFIRAAAPDMTAESALAALMNLNGPRAFDLGHSNFGFFLNVASVGIDACIALRAQHLKKYIKGPAIYLIASLIEIIRFRPEALKVTMDGVVIEEPLTLVAIANGRYYGAGMPIAPNASLDDGSYEVIVAKHAGKLRLLRLLPRLLKGSHIFEPEVRIYRCQEIEIKSEKMLLVNHDGELSESNYLKADMHAAKINVFVNI